ncbi:MAG TPA: ATP-binding cassette domain-containing protein [Candidatus Dormibacteraeota bacterium]|nr:ATP-binding cassette domain-containing protein [Candidatus Dormibacteraeota bacterium]
MSAVIQTDALTKHFRKVSALDHLTCEVPEGSLYALVGPNGAGKTTAIKVLMNLIPATSGRAKVLGMDSKQIRGKSYSQIGYVSENQEIPEWMSVGALLEYLRDFYPTWDRTLEDSLIKQFELPRDRKIKGLDQSLTVF